MNVLALNCGSSSVKFRLLAVDPDADAPQSRALAGGSVDRLGASAHVLFEGDGRVVRAEAPVASHEEAVDRVLRWLAAGPAHIDAVGHRVVHGGARFAAPTLIDDAVIAAVEALDTLAPLHNRLPERTAHYAIPWDLPVVTGSGDSGFTASPTSGRAPARPRCSDGRSSRHAWSCCTWAAGARRRRSGGACRWTPPWGSRRSRGS
jgi:hypothetical protein